MEALDILKKYWGHNSFRLKQEEVINSVINKQDTLALLPTGGGKSICYQIPAIMNDGICIVVSPLISLMNDQIRHLQSKGIKSTAISSKMYSKEIETVLNNCIYGKIKFLYLSPEKLRNEDVKRKLELMNINLIAVDEAHCISQWGHNFRPAYRLINEIREVKKGIPILALTATANKLVIEDIQENLKFNKENLIKSSFFRKNLSYVSTIVNNKNETLLKLLSKIKSSVIIYVGTRRQSNEVSLFLNNNKISTKAYHAGIDNIKRNNIQNSWVKNETRVIVATNAFGLGIDKSDVKLVVHMQLPMNIESYFQESGRAGRNGKTAYSFLLVNKSDIKKNKEILSFRHPEIKEIRNIYQRIADDLQIAVNTLPEEEFLFDIQEFSQKYQLNISKTFHILKYLEQEDYLKLYENTFGSSKIKIAINNSDLYKFQIANGFFDNFIRVILRKYPGIFNNFINIDEKKLSYELKISTEKLTQILKQLENKGILEYKEKTEGMHLIYLQNRIDAERLQISKERLQESKDYNNKQLDEIINYAYNRDQCRSVLLLKYFGENNSERCQVCDFCINKNRKELKQKEFQEISRLVLRMLQVKEYSIENIFLELKDYKKEKIENVLNYLFDKDKISKHGEKFLVKSN